MSEANSTNIENIESEDNQLKIFCEFINLLGLSAADISFRLIPEHPALKSVDPTARIVRAGKYPDAKELFKVLSGHNKRGYAVFWQPQVFAGKSEHYTTLRRVRFIVCDCDIRGLESARAAKDAGGLRCVVESSKGKTQLIYKIVEGSEGSVANGVPVNHEDINEVMRSIAGLFGGDSAACKAVQIFRVPGFYWCKKGTENKYLSRVLYSDDSAEVSLEELRIISQLKVRGESVLSHGAMHAEARSVVASEQGKVLKGSRHDELVKRGISWLMQHGAIEGDDHEFRDSMHSMIRGEFQEGMQWLLEDSAEIERCLRDAEGYARDNRRRDKEEVERMQRELASNEGVSTSVEAVTIPESKIDFTGYEYKPRRASRGVQPYSDAAMFDRLIDLFVDSGEWGKKRRGGDIYPWVIRAEETQNIYAWSEIDKVWRNCGSSASGVRSGVLSDMVVEAIELMIAEKGFAKYYGYDADGESKPYKLQAAILKYNSGNTLANCIKYAYSNSSSFPQKSILDFNSVEGVLPVAGKQVLDVRSALRLRGMKLLGGNVVGWPESDDACGIIVRDVRASDLITVQGKIKWKGLDASESECKGWLQFLSEIYHKTEDVSATIEMMQRIFGLALSTTKDRVMYVHSGGGCNGKSLTLKALRLMSGDFCAVLAGDDLVSRKGGFGNAAFERMAVNLINKRAAIIDDMDAGDTWNQALIKNLTSDVLPARYLYGERSEIKNTCKMHVALNVLPGIDKENNGIMDRLCIIPYDMRFKNDPSADIRLSSMIEDELGGILAWSVRGWIKREASSVAGMPKVVYSQDVRDSVHDYRTESFMFEEAANQCFECDDTVDFMKYNNSFGKGGGNTRTKGEGKLVRSEMEQLYPDYKPYTNEQLKMLMEERGFTNIHTQNGGFIKALNNIFPTALKRRLGDKRETVLYLKLREEKEEKES